MAIAPPPVDRQIYCNRTLNLRSIRAIGYDMDYTLIHYRVDEWEKAGVPARQGSPDRSGLADWRSHHSILSR